MKTFLSLCAGAAFCILASCSEGPTKQMPYNQGINVIPTPVSLVQNEGSFKLSKNTAFSASTPEAKTVAEYFAAQMNLATGYQITVSDKAASNGIALAIDEALDVNDDDEDLTIIVDGAQGRFRTTNWYITAAVTLLSGMLAYFVSGRALKPLRRFASQVEQVQLSNLADMKISEDVLPEFRQFSHSFNQMLERLNNAFAAQRQFTGNAAHGPA